MKRALSLFLVLILTLTALPSFAESAVIKTNNPDIELLISEVCFNPPNMTASDVFEYIEMVNVSNNDIDLAGGWFTCANDDGTANRNDIFPEEKKPLRPGQAAVFLIYGLSASTEGYLYETAKDRENLLKAFNETYGSNVDKESFYLIPRAVSGGKNQSGRFALSNTAEKVEICFYTADGAKHATAVYSASKYNRNGYSVGFSLSKTEGNRFMGLAAMTPGYFQEELWQKQEGDFTETIKAMTYNICASGVTTDPIDPAYQGDSVPHESLYIKNRYPALLGFIEREDPDILCLNEVNGEWWKYIGNALCGKTGKYEFYGYTTLGHPLSGLLTYKWDTAPVILYKRDKFTAVKSAFFFCPPDSRNLVTTNNMVLLQSSETGAQFVFVTQHLATESEDLRYKSAAVIAEEVKKFAEGLPTIIMGDYNTYEGKAGYQKFIEEGYVDSARLNPDVDLLGSYDAWQLGENRRNQFIYLPIDLMMVTKGDFSVKSYSVLTETIASGYDLSDHCPVKIEFGMKHAENDAFTMIEKHKGSIKDGYYICESYTSKDAGLADFISPALYDSDCGEYFGTGNSIFRKDGSGTLTVIAQSDVSGDGKITSADYIAIKKFLSGQLKFTPAQLLAADSNGDSKITSVDYLTVRSFFGGK